MRRPSPEERFFAKVVEDGECWVWTGATTVAGYGTFKLRSYHNVLAHRWVYEFLVADIPGGLTIDHLCRNPPCVNPAHLEPVTVRVNNARQPRRGDTCGYGHEFTPENTRFYITDVERNWTARRCRTCDVRRSQEYRAKLRLAAEAVAS